MVEIQSKKIYLLILYSGNSLKKNLRSIVQDKKYHNTDNCNGNNNINA